MKNLSSSLFLSILLVAVTCVAKEPPGPRVVDLTAADGTKLKASYFSAGKPGPVVLLLHQCDHERKIWDGLAQQLAAAGINVLTFDLRGFGDSGGEPHHKDGPLEPPEEIQKWPGDIDVAFQYLKSQPDVKTDPIGVGGASCGVDNAIKTAMRHPEVKSLVLLSGPHDLQDRKFMRQGKLPAFFAVADDDQYPGMVELTEWLYIISSNSGKKFAHYRTGHHGAEIFAVHPDLPVAIVDWYVTTLIKTPGHAPATTDVAEIPAYIRAIELLDQPGGPARLARMLSESRQKDPKAPFTPEQMMEGVAYEHLQAGDIKQALEILKLDATAYPNSPNVYDCLGEAYLADGQKDLARKNTQKALELLPSDTVDPQAFRDAIKASAEERLKQLGPAQ
ncbi:MAG TPA: alpha/beta fold hydrolase [Verrucomicrobiae bacterium]|jgi:dienelactone hydrolase|nr:alpha/beta fold hydrolase [Verrucomicrobiae bacterium]